MAGKITRANPYLEEIIEVLDIHYERHGGNDDEARAYLSKDDNQWIDDEIFKCITDTRYFISNYYAYRDEKEGFKGLYPFFDSQEILCEEYRKLEKLYGRVRALVLKARQMGSSTYNMAEFFHKTIFAEHINSIVVGQDEDQSTFLMSMYESALDFIPWWMRPRIKIKQTGKQINFDEKDEWLRQMRPGLKTWVYADNGRKPTGVGRGKTFGRAMLCLSASNRVLKDDGYTESIANVRPGDRVLSENGFVRVRATSERNASTVYKGAEIGFKIISACNRAFPVEGTGNHTVMACEKYRYGDGLRYRNERMYELRELTNQHALVIPVVPITSDGSYPKSQTFGGSPQGGGVVNKWTPPEPSREFGFAIGLYLAEGSSLKGKIALSLNTGEEHLAERFAKAVRSKSHPFPCKTSKTIVHYFYNRSMAEWFAAFCGKKDGKRFDWSFWKLGRQFLAGVVEGILLGDGHFAKHGNNVFLTTIREQLAIGLREAALSLGYGYGGISTRDGGFHYGRNCRKSWTVIFSGSANRDIRNVCGKPQPSSSGRRGNLWCYSDDGSKIQVHIRSIERVQLENVYDIEVESSTHLFRLAGALTHNSELAFWEDLSQLSKSLFPTFNTPDGFYIMESTANGRNDAWHNLWRRAEAGKVDWHPIFIPFYRREKTYSLPVLKTEVFVVTDQEKEMRERVLKKEGYLIKDEMFNWMRKKKEEFVATDGDDMMFSQEYTSEPEESFQSSAITAFPRGIINKYSRRTINPQWIGEIYWDFDAGKPKPVLKVIHPDYDLAYPEEDDRLHVWEMPQRGCRYSVGVDVSLGNPGGDYSCIAVVKMSEGMERDQLVAVWHGYMNPEPLAEIVLAICWWYEEALAAVEVNAMGMTTNNALMRDFEYENIYRFKRLDRLKNFMTDIVGWYTNANSKRALMTKMDRALREDLIDIPCKWTVDEFRDFTEEGAIGEGAHDDYVMALMIALFAGHEGEVQERRAKPHDVPADANRFIVRDRNGVIMYEGTSMQMAEATARKIIGSQIERISGARAKRQFGKKMLDVPADYQNTAFSPVHDKEGTASRLHYEEDVPAEFITPEMIQEYDEREQEMEDDPDAWMYQ